MRRTSADPWAGEKMSRSDAHRRYVNLIVYQLRPMVADRRLNDEMRIQVLKRIVREASRFKYESGMVAGSGAREEVVEVLTPWLKPEHWAGPELKDWCVRTIRAFGATIASDDD